MKTPHNHDESFSYSMVQETAKEQLKRRGYYPEVQLDILELQLIEEVKTAKHCSRNNCEKCAARESQDDNTLSLKIRHGVSFIRNGRMMDAFKAIDEASKLSNCGASLLHLVAGDLGRVVKRPFDACNAYNRIDYHCRPFYVEAASSKGRLYTSILKRWREFGLKPYLVAWISGEGGERDLVELLPDPDHLPARNLSEAVKLRLRSLGENRHLYVEISISSLLGEEFEAGELPVYGYSRIGFMGPYITSSSEALKAAMKIVYNWMSDDDDKIIPKSDEEGEITSEYLDRVIRMSRIPQEYKRFKSNIEIAQDMICGRKLRYAFGRGESERDWLKWLSSIEPEGN